MELSVDEGAALDLEFSSETSSKWRLPIDRVGREEDDQCSSLKGSLGFNSLANVVKMLEGSVYSTFTFEADSITAQPKVELCMSHVQYFQNFASGMCAINYHRSSA